MANEKIIAQKEKEVNELAEKIKAAKIVLLTDYRGITVDSVTRLRADLRKASTEYKVIKNNITRRALEKDGYTDLDASLEGHTAVVINNEDYLDTAKTIYEFTKANDFYKIKGGIIDGKVMTTEEIVTLAKLPSKETLIGMLAGALLGNISNLAVALDQVKVQKEANA